MSTERLNEIKTELVSLTAELQSVSARALPLVEELENNHGVPTLGDGVEPEVKAMFRTIHVLVTMLG